MCDTCQNFLIEGVHEEESGLGVHTPELLRLGMKIKSEAFSDGVQRETGDRNDARDGFVDFSRKGKEKEKRNLEKERKKRDASTVEKRGRRKRRKEESRREQVEKNVLKSVKINGEEGEDRKERKEIPKKREEEDERVKNNQ